MVVVVVAWYLAGGGTDGAGVEDEDDGSGMGELKLESPYEGPFYAGD